MEKTNFDDLLQRYLEGMVTSEEKLKLEAWLEMRKTKGTANLELSTEDEERLFRKIASKTVAVPEVENFHPGQKKRYDTPLIAIAASLLVLAVSFFVWKSNENRIVATTKTILADGTIVWASNESNINYFEKDDKRFCTMEGDALFEVAKDASRPFVIHVATVDIQVVGTSFRIDTNEEDVEISVFTGKVQVTTSTGELQTAEARQKLMIRSEGKSHKKTLQQEEINAMIRGSEYNMKFENASLREVLHRIELKFDKTVTLANAGIGDCRISADFTDRSLKSTMEMISEVLDVRYQIDGNILTLSGKGCR